MSHAYSIGIFFLPKTQIKGDSKMLFTMTLTWTDIFILSIISGVVGHAQTLWITHKINKLRWDIKKPAPSPAPQQPQNNNRGKKR